MPRRRPAESGRTRFAADGVHSAPRIIGGTLGGRKLHYSGEARTRPMKDRLRESIFNRIGPTVPGAHAIDLFAGTGALGLEAISRGAARATFVEHHFPTAELIRQNIATLAVERQCQVIAADTFVWVRRLPDLGSAPWLVFCSPPFALYHERRDDVLDLLGRLIAAATSSSVFVVEADERFDFGLLPVADAWDVRSNPPAVVGIWRK